ncbi:glycosyltransferase family protein [Marinagarivorans algicola]|uniref:hypothetical protein n=1 Tax=Marinagarivorans algicola TaxID=1513270 RepID=UPI00373679A8
MKKADISRSTVQQTPRETLLVFGEDWHGLPSSTRHLIKPLCAQYHVVWINSIGLRQPRLNKQDMQRILCKLRQFMPSSESISAPTINSPIKPSALLNLKTFPAPKSHLMRKLCGQLMARQIQHALNKLGAQQPIIWASLPTAIDAIKYLAHKKIIYYCCDDFTSLAGVDHETVAIHEKELLNRADLVIASQQQLAQNLSLRLASSDTHKAPKILPHGVDYLCFSQVASMAPDLPNNNKPTAGFYGSIASWLDFSLLNTVIARHQDWNFVFIGHIETEASTQFLSLSKQSNVYYLGPKEHQQLPQYSQHWQASLLPFRHCDQINHCNPLKLREYLAAGSSIISTDFPAIDEYKNIINIAHTPEQFSQHLNAISALSHSQKIALQKKQRLLVKNHSWQARSQEIKLWMDQL